MAFNDESSDDPPSISSPHPSTPVFLKDNTVAIYTILTVLLKMKSTLGMEAMLEYIVHYSAMIERHNPVFKDAVQHALSLMSVEKMYRDGTQHNN